MTEASTVVKCETAVVTTAVSHLTSGGRGTLNHVWVQLAVVPPQPLARVVQKLLRVLPRAREPVHHPAGQHVLRPFAFPDLLEQSLADLFHDVALGLEFGAAHGGPVCRNDPRLFIRD